MGAQPDLITHHIFNVENKIAGQGGPPWKIINTMGYLGGLGL